MNVIFDSERSRAVRALLVEQATAAAAPRRRVWRASVLIAIGALGGAALSTAAFAANQAADPAMPSGQPNPAAPAAIDAPAGIVPGAPVTALLGESAVLPITGDTTFSLADRPSGATHVRVTISPLTAGGVLWGTDSAGNNPSASFTASDVAAGQWTEDDFALDDTTDALYVTPDGGFTGIAAIQYITEVPTHLAINANGETYGAEGGPDGSPDLVLAWATASDGTQIEAYVRTEQLGATSPDHPGQPTSPAQALEWQDEAATRYPDGWDIPAYESDGVTQVGTFRVGG